MIDMILAAPWWVWLIVALIVGAGAWCWFAQQCFDDTWDRDNEGWYL